MMHGARGITEEWGMENEEWGMENSKFLRLS